MRDSAAISGNSAAGYGGGVHNNKTFTMQDNAIVSGNSASNHGGGVSNYGGTFRIGGGVIYGSGAATGQRNTASSGATLYNYDGTAQFGTFSGETFYPSGNLSTTNDTIQVH
jgi:hypothetical protein